MTKPIKVAALTSGRDVPSARFRVRQHIAPLRLLSVQVVDYCPAISQLARLPGKLGRIRQRYLPPIAAGQVALNAALRIPGVFGTYRSDVTWIERNFLPGLDRLGCLTKAPRVLDVDDAIWLSALFGASSTRVLAAEVDAVIAGNSYLANWYSQYCKNIFIVPTAIDCERFRPIEGGRPSRDASTPFIVGWTGSSGNFRFLEKLQVPLATFLRGRPTALLKIIADRKPALPEIPAAQTIFIKWDPENEAIELRDMDVGLMPLDDDEWAKGKCSFKMLQYMATAVPVIVSPVGMNKEVLELGQCGFAARNGREWLDALVALYENWELGVKFGQTGREIVLSRFSVHVVVGQLADVFRKTS